MQMPLTAPRKLLTLENSTGPYPEGISYRLTGMGAQENVFKKQRVKLVGLTCLLVQGPQKYWYYQKQMQGHTFIRSMALSVFLFGYRGNRLIVSSEVDLLTSRQHIATRKQLSSRAHDRSEKAKESNNHELQSQLREGSSP